MNNTPLNLAQILSALKRHKFKAAFAWLIVFSAVVAAFLVWPRTYGSEGRLYVQLGRNNSGLNPTVGSSSISIQDSRETEILSVVELIKSRAVLERVVSDIGAAEILRNPLADILPEIQIPSFRSSKGDGEMSVDRYRELTQAEQAAKYLEKNLIVHAAKKTSVISVFVKANSAKLAQRIVNQVFVHTRDVHLSVHAAKGTSVFFDSQFQEQEKQLVESVNRLAEFRNQKQVLSIGAARDSLQSIVSAIDSDLLGAEVALAESEQRLNKLRELMAQTDAQIEMPKTGVERLSYEDSRTELFKLESERERLIATYHTNHPEVLRVESQLKRVRMSLDSMANDRTESAMMSNPVYENMQVDFLRAEAENSVAKVRLASLNTQHAQSLEKLKELNQSDIESDQLQRDVDIARQYLAIYTQKRGEAKAMSLLDDQNISDVVVAQQPNFVVKHMSPKGSLIIPLGFFCGLLAALATALFFERNHLSASLNEDDVEQVLDLPVLVTLPRVYSSRNMVN